MRIAVVGPTHPYKGGIALHTTKLAHQLAAHGHEVRLESWAKQYPKFLYPGQQRIETPETAPFPATRHTLSWSRPDSWWRVGSRIGRDVDLLVVVMATPVQVPAQLTLIRAARRAAGGRLTVVGLAHNVLPHERRAVDRFLLRAVFRRCDAILTHSERLRDQALTLVMLPVAVAALPPHLPDTPETLAPRRAAHRRLLFFGIVRPYKGLDLLLDALAELPEVSLDVVGEFWGGLEETRARIARLGIGDRVRLRPEYVAADELPGVFADVDALVLPYRTATGSQNTHLGHRFGVPVIASDAGTLAATVHDGADGLVFRAGDVRDLVRALTTLYDGDTLERLSSGVTPPDEASAWKPYVDTLVTLAGAVHAG